MREEEVVLRPGTLVKRPLVVLIAVPALLSMMAVIYIAFGAATMEFKYGCVSRDTEYPPVITAAYRDICPWGWVGPTLGVAGLIALLCRQRCTVGALALYIGFVAVFTTLWLTVTLLAFYLGNRHFSIIIG